MIVENDATLVDPPAVDETEATLFTMEEAKAFYGTDQVALQAVADGQNADCGEGYPCGCPGFDHGGEHGPRVGTEEVAKADLDARAVFGLGSGDVDQEGALAAGFGPEVADLGGIAVDVAREFLDDLVVSDAHGVSRVFRRV